jgi:threonine synthase
MPPAKLKHHILVCLECGAQLLPEQAPADFRCAECGGLFEVQYAPNDEQAVELRARWLVRRVSRHPINESGVWRFREMLPLMRDEEDIVTLREGNTPVYDMPQSAEYAGTNTLHAKHQGMNPTGSFKDTGMTVAVSVAKARSFEWVACASTGNTSASMAAYSARAGMRSLVLIPEGKIAWSKLSQALDAGALTCQLGTDFDGCVKVLQQIVDRAPVYLLNSVNPYRLEGQKTPAFELAEQMDWRVPDHIIVPGGNLANGSALGLGFMQMLGLGLISRLPKISIIQAEGANPLVRSMAANGGKTLEPVEANTRATAIRIGNPASWRKAVRILEETGGYCGQVSEAEIAIAKAIIGRDGIGCEPASAVTLAGLRKLVAEGKISKSDSVVLILTGHGLKDPDYTLDFHRNDLFEDDEVRSQEDAALIRRLMRAPLVMDATPDAVLRALDNATTGKA